MTKRTFPDEPQATGSAMAKSNSGDSDFSDYAPVSARITLFYERYPTGRIVTRLHSRSEREVTFRAYVFRGPNDPKPAASGWASEREGDGEINAVACLENTETSAIGRALANLGFTASTRRPSREEMDKAARERARLGKRPAIVAEPAPTPTPRPSIDADPLQRRANALQDVLSLIERAEAIGFSEVRAKTLRNALLQPQPDSRAMIRLEFRVRAWIARHRPHRR